MKVYAVFSKESNFYDEWDALVSIYSTRELADNHAKYEIGDYFVMELDIIEENNSFTKYAMKAVADGKIKLTKNGGHSF